MAARSTLERSAIEASRALEERPPATVLKFARPPLEAMDDLDWLVNESNSDMGESSAFGAMLERASRERELVILDDSYMHGKRPGVYGKSLTDQPWGEWVEDATIRRGKESPARVVEGKYFRETWGRRHEQTPVTAAYELGVHNILATEMVRNLGEVLDLLPKRMRHLLLTRHRPNVHTVAMRAVFGNELARVAHLAKAAADAFAKAEGVVSSLPAWLEAIAARVHDRKPKAGETTLCAAIKKENDRELREAYQAFEKARMRLPARTYPHHDRERRDARRSLVSRG